MSRSILTRCVETIVLFLAAASLEAQDVTTVPIDLFINGQPQGNVSCRIAGDSIQAEKTKLVESLRSVLEAPRLAELQNAAAPEGYLDVTRLGAFGVQSRYDPGALRLDLTVSPADRKAQVLKIGTGPPANLPVETPADFSAYLNMRALTGLQSTTVPGTPPSFSLPTQLVLQPVANYRGWVLDAGTTSSLVSTGTFSLDYARVSHDFVESSRRLTIGSLFMPVTGFMVSQPTYGVEFVQDPRMTQSLHDFAPLPRQFLLPQASTVSVLLNSTNIGAYHLDAGRYVIPNVPFEDGLNSFSVRSGDVLLQEVIPYDSRLLAQGAMSYSAGIGAPQWELAIPELSGFFDYGVTPFLTAGVFTQDGLEAQMGGVEGTYATPVGNFHAQLGVSRAPLFDFGGELDYRLAFRYGMYYPVVGLSAQYTGKSFTAPSLSSSQSPNSWAFTATYSQPLPYQFGLGLGLGYQVGWAPAPDQVTAAVTIARPIGANTSVNCIWSFTRAGSSPVQVQLTVMLSSVQDNGRQSIFASTSLDRPSASTSFTYQPSPLLPRGTFSLSQDGTTVSGSAGASYFTPFVDSSLTDSFSPSFNSLNLSAGAALVTAGGLFGVTRPVSDSFAILAPTGTMLGQTVVVDRTADSYAGMVTDRVNIGVSDLASYTRRTVNLASPTAPADSDLGPSIRLLQPTYKSGTVVTVGTRASVFITGTLTSAGAPMAYRAGKLASGSRSEVFFTDEDGSFQVYNLEPGTWTLSIDGTGLTKQIDIPQTATRRYDVGTIALEVAQ